VGLAGWTRPAEDEDDTVAKLIITLSTTFANGKHEGDSSKLVCLTELEVSALAAVALNGMTTMGGSEPADLHADNCSWFNQGDIMKWAGVTTMQARGLMTFLSRKGLVADHGVDKGDRKRDHWYVSSEGINAAQHLWTTINQVDAAVIARRPALARFLALGGF